MKYKTLFRLLLKAIGVWLFVQGAVEIPTLAGWAVFAVVSGGTFSPAGYEWIQIVSILGLVLQLGAGLYLFFGGRWIVNLAIPGNRPYCQECGYDLSGAPRDRCPECDTPFRREDVRPARPLEPTQRPPPTTPTA